MFGSWILLGFLLFSWFCYRRELRRYSPLTQESASHPGVHSLLGKRKMRAVCTIPTNMDAADLGGFKRINAVL